MNGKQSSKLKGLSFFCLVFLLSFSSSSGAQPRDESEGGGQEASASQAQATMASLFGRGAKMPGIPSIRGTIALPAFDSKGMKIDEGSLEAAQRRERSPGNRAQNA